MMMDKFITDSEEEYYKEKDGREKIYRDACKVWGVM